MYNQNKWKYPYNTTTYKKPPTKIKTTTDLRNVGVILMDDDVMQKIKNQSGPLANSCEYQVHYLSLNIRSKGQDGTILDICVPTVFFNYKQEVTGARIDFELTDVASMSKQLEAVHSMKAQEFLASDTYAQICAIIPAERQEIVLSHQDMSSLHKHP